MVTHESVVVTLRGGYAARWLRCAVVTLPGGYAARWLRCPVVTCTVVTCTVVVMCTVVVTRGGERACLAERRGKSFCMRAHCASAVWSAPESSNSCKSSKSAITSAGSDEIDSRCACLLRYEYEWREAPISGVEEPGDGISRGEKGEGGGESRAGGGSTAGDGGGLARVPERRA